MTDSTHTDVAVVGAGPIGLELAAALKRSKIDYLHFDAKQIGYTISWFAPGTRFFSSNERIAIAGVPLQTPDQSKCTREQYLAYLRSVAVQFDLQVNTYEPIIGIERDGGPNGCFVLTTQPASGKKVYRANRLVLCTGGTDRPRRLGIPGEDLPHVSHYFDDPHTYFRKRLLIVGGKNSAVEAALRCHAAGADVSFSYRRAQLNAKSIKYWLMPEINGLIESGKIPAWFGTVPTAITPASVRLEGVGRDPSRRELAFDFVLLLIGYEQDNALFKLAGIDIDPVCGAPKFNPATMETNVPGLYVAGTAVGGTQEKYTVFIENCHVHAERIVAAMIGVAPPEAPAPLAQPES
jgi:thioredoxin reductase (NADPH)